MKVFIRRKNTGEYFCGSREWAPERFRAYDFGSSIVALTFCTDYRLLEVEILLCFGDPRFDVALPSFTPPGGRDSEEDPPTPH